MGSTYCERVPAGSGVFGCYDIFLGTSRCTGVPMSPVDFKTGMPLSRVSADMSLIYALVM